LNHPELVSRLKEGDRTAFSALVEAMQDMVYNTAVGIVQDATDAEDITQEVFVTVFEEMKSFNENSSLKTWMYRITINKSLDHEKKKRRLKHGGLLQRVFGTNEKTEPLHFDHPGVLFDQKESAVMLFKAIKQLPEQQRIAFTLQKLEGLTNQEIAGVMENSVAGIESLLARAKNNLRNFLKSYYEKESN
jgi:RNA polymerase sigma factor (sigma-70 family)